MVTFEESIPQYTDKYRFARSIFYEQFNDVDFYVEDLDSENLYYCILRRLFPNVRFESIHPLNGKGNVIDHARQNTSSRKAVYLLDKDFDDLLGTVYQQENVFYLDGYCIENFLLEETSVIGFIVSERTNLKPSSIKGKLSFDTQWDMIVKLLSPLFATFFLVLKHKIQVESTSQHPKAFHSPNDFGAIDADRIFAYRKKVRTRAVQMNLDIDLEAQLAACDSTFELSKQKHLLGRHVSGQFILYFLFQRVKQLFQLETLPDSRSLAYRLAAECSFQSLGGLRTRIERYLNKT